MKQVGAGAFFSLIVFKENSFYFFYTSGRSKCSGGVTHSLSSTLNWLESINVSSASGRGEPLVFQPRSSRCGLWPPVVRVSFSSPFPLLSPLLISKVTMQRIQTVLNVKAQHPTESPVADLCHLLVGSPKMHRFIIPARGVLGFLQEMCDGGCPQRPGLSPWRVEATSFYFFPRVREEVRWPLPSARSVCICCSCLLFPSRSDCTVL